MERCSPWGRKESDMTEHWIELNWSTSLGTPRIGSKCLRLEDTRRGSSLQLSEGPISAMIADLYPPEIWKYKLLLVVVQLPSWVWLFATPWAAAHQASLSFTVSQSLLKIMSIESVMPSDHLIFCCPLLLLPSIFPSTGVFSNESVLPFRWPKYWSFSFRISPSNEYSGLISFRIDCLLSKWLSKVFSGTTVWKHQFFHTQPSLWSNSHIHTWLLEKP